MRVNIDLTQISETINNAFYPLLRNESRHLILRGGAGSGKSYFVAQKILLRILKDFNTVKHDFLCVRKTQPAVRKSVFKLLLRYIDWWGLKDLCKVHRTNMSIEFLTGSTITCIGLDDPEKLKSIVGVTSVWVEEATELSLDDAQQINLRLRGITPSYKQIMYSFNPVSKANWIYKRFFENEDQEGNTFLHHSTYKDNRFIDEAYKKEVEDLINQNPTYYSIYAKGDWGVLEHIIYNNYDVIEKFPHNSMEDIVYGIDFGYNVPSAMVKVGKKGDEFYLDEKIYQDKLTNKDLIKKIKFRYPENKPLYCDSAAPERIEELKKAGLNAKKAYKGKNSVKDGIDYIKRSKLHITKGSVNLLKEIAGYTYKQDRDGVVYDEPIKFGDHAMDAFRYAIYTRWGKRRSYGAFV